MRRVGNERNISIANRALLCAVLHEATYYLLHLRAWFALLLACSKGTSKGGLLRSNFHFELIQIHSKNHYKKGEKRAVEKRKRKGSGLFLGGEST